MGIDDLVREFGVYRVFVAGNYGILIAGAVVIVLFLASGSMAASVAETRQHSPWGHLFLGLLLPIAYPAIIFFTMDIKTGKSKSRDASEGEPERMAGAPPVESPLAMADDLTAELLDGAMLDQQVNIYNQDYFKRAATDISGNVKGPFIFRIGGEEIRAEHIVEALPQLVIIETIHSDGKSQTLRLPYARIDAFEEL